MDKEVEGNGGITSMKVPIKITLAETICEDDQVAASSMVKKMQ
jgi:hypothetical protein